MSQSMLRTLDFSDPDILDRINLQQLSEEVLQSHLAARQALMDDDVCQQAAKEMAVAFKRLDAWLKDKAPANPEWRKHAVKYEQDDPASLSIKLVEYSDDPDVDLRFKRDLYYKGLQQCHGIPTITRNVSRQKKRKR